MKQILGYEPEMEKFDQSPYHNNEVGSQDKPVLAIKGAKVPLAEGNSDVKQRWTANLTTFSNMDRIDKGELPYCELMFKAAADGKSNCAPEKLDPQSRFPEMVLCDDGAERQLPRGRRYSFLRHASREMDRLPSLAYTHGR